jgi:probable rRNA maturation factor
MSYGQTDREKKSAAWTVLLSNRQTSHAVDEAQLIAAACEVLRDSTFTSAEISLAVVDDHTIHDLNREYLDHDWPTDVLSFVLSERNGHLEGEVILSADTAATEAAEIGWPVAAEQLLYVIHGMLHLVGYRDKSEEDAAVMRAAEKQYLKRFGFNQPELPPETPEA